MKKLRITLNDQVFDVQVEVLEDDETRYPGAASPTYAPIPAAPAPTPKAAPAPRPAAPASAATGSLIAPIVGSVSKILVEPGSQVEENQPLLVLDAMKMDTYINAPRSATVAAIHCRIGETVQVGQKLVSFS